MENDFNPFDLSAPPKVIEQPKAEATDFAGEAKVHRVSMGPLFHSKITRTLAFILSIVLFGLVGYLGMDYYLMKQELSKQSSKPLMLQLTHNKSKNI